MTWYQITYVSCVIAATFLGMGGLSIIASGRVTSHWIVRILLSLPLFGSGLFILRDTPNIVNWVISDDTVLKYIFFAGIPFVLFFLLHRIEETDHSKPLSSRVNPKKYLGPAE